MLLFWIWVGVIHTCWSEKLAVRIRCQDLLHWGNPQNCLYAKLIPIQRITQIGRLNDTQQNVVLWYLNSDEGTKSETKNSNVLFISFFIDEHKGIYSVILLRTQMESLTIALDTGVKGSKIITQRGVDVGGFCVAQWAVSISGGLVVWIPSGILMKTLHSLPHRGFLLLCSFAVRVNVRWIFNIKPDKKVRVVTIIS